MTMVWLWLTAPTAASLSKQSAGCHCPAFVSAQIHVRLTTKVRHSLPQQNYEYTKRLNGRLLSSTALFAFSWKKLRGT
jgi:hypothetical protein